MNSSDAKSHLGYGLDWVGQEWAEMGKREE